VGYFVFGCMALLFVVWQVTWVARKHASALGSDVSRTFLMCGCLTIFLWFLYPIAGVFARVVTLSLPTPRLSSTVFSTSSSRSQSSVLLIWGHRGIEPARLGLHVRDYDDVPGVSAPPREASQWNHRRSQQRCQHDYHYHRWETV
jgi:hypothetical protein